MSSIVCDGNPISNAPAGAIWTSQHLTTGCASPRRAPWRCFTRGYIPAPLSGAQQGALICVRTRVDADQAAVIESRMRARD